jgi:cytosine/adenosine deaminase-related metal-dependent hydrolase
MPPGLSTIQEVELLVKAGLSREAALKAATSGAARHLGLEKEIGALETGTSADILLVRGDPLRSIADPQVLGAATHVWPQVAADPFTGTARHRDDDWRRAGSLRARNVSSLSPPRATLRLSHSTVKPAAVSRLANAVRLQ